MWCARRSSRLRPRVVLLVLALAVLVFPAADERREEDEEGDPQLRDPLKLYVSQIGGRRLLTPGEERELARRKDAGDQAAASGASATS